MKLRKIFCEIVEGAVYEDRCLFKLSQVIDGNPTCKACILQELEALKKEKMSHKKRKHTRKPGRPKVLKNPKKDQKFYNTQEVSELLNISLRTIQRWAEKGKIPSKKIGSKLKYPKEEINRWVEERKKSNGSSMDQPSRTVDNGGRDQIPEGIKDDDPSTPKKGGDSGS